MSAHVKAQALRFLRVSALAFVAALFTTGGKISLSSLWAMLAGAGETGLRELAPVTGLPTVTAVPASPPADPTPPAKG